MNNIKAILIGISMMIFLGLSFELIFLFVDIGYGKLMTQLPIIEFVRQIFNYAFIVVGLFFVMFSGGYLTSVYAHQYKVLNSVMAASITSAVALYAAGSGYQLTFFSILFVVVSIAFALYGNHIYKQNDLDNHHNIKS